MKENIVRFTLIALLLISIFFNFKLRTEVSKQKELAASNEMLAKKQQEKITLLEIKVKDDLAKSQALFDNANAKLEELKAKK